MIISPLTDLSLDGIDMYNGYSAFGANGPLTDRHMPVFSYSPLAAGKHLYVNNVSLGRFPRSAASEMTQVQAAPFRFYDSSGNAIDIPKTATGNVWPEVNETYYSGQFLPGYWSLIVRIDATNNVARYYYGTTNNNIASQGGSGYRRFRCGSTTSHMLMEHNNELYWGLCGGSTIDAPFGVATNVKITDTPNLQLWLEPRFEPYNGPWYT